MAWLSLLAPPLTLASWLAGFTLWPWLLASLVAAPPTYRMVLAALRHGGPRTRYLSVQAFGLGCLLMPLLLPGALLQLIVSPFSSGLIVLLLWTLITVHANRQAHVVHDANLTVNVPRLQTKVRVVQISDVHVGSRSATFLAKVVAQVQSHAPDIVVVTGDLLDTSSVGREELAPLARLTCPVLMCIGNHECHVPLAPAIEAIESAGVKVLRDAALDLQGIRFVGMDDAERPDTLAERLARTDTGDAAYRILLYHRPDGWAAAREHGIDLMLAGHTHAGQIWPFGLMVKRRYPHMVGRFDDGPHTLYVSPGTGTWGPALRLGTRCEMTVIDLRPDTVNSRMEGRD